MAEAPIDAAGGDDSDMAIALRRKVDFVGKTSRKSKVAVFWAFQSRRGSKFRHEVKMTYSSNSGKRRIWFNGTLVHTSHKFTQKSSVPHKYKWEGGGYTLECLSLKNNNNYKINLVVDHVPFIKLPRRRSAISLNEIFDARRMCRADGTWGQSTAVALGCTSEHLGKRLSGSKRKIQYTFVFIDSPRKEHVAEIMYSILSGKRQVKLDGRLIHKSQKLQMSLSFKYAFTELGHMFELLVKEKSDMILTRLCVDGMDFRRLPLVSREQLGVALASRKSRCETMDFKMSKGLPDADDDDFEMEGASGDEEEEEGQESDQSADSEEGGGAAAPEALSTMPTEDLLADLFGEQASIAPKAPAFDPFAARPPQAPAADAAPNTTLAGLFGRQPSGIDFSDDQSPSFCSSPTVSKVQRVMDPFSNLVQQRNQLQKQRNDAAASFDPFNSGTSAPPESQDPFMGF